MANEQRRRGDGSRTGSGWSSSGVALSILVHLLAVALIFLAPHPMEAPHPTAYTVEIVDPSAVGGQLLEGPIGGASKSKPAPKPPPPAEPPPPPEPPPPEEPPPPPEQLAKVDEPRPVPEEDDDPDAVPVGTPRATATVVRTATPRPEPTARATKQPTARPTAKPTPRASATAAATAKPKATATAAVVVAKKGTAVRAEPTPPPKAAATPAAETRSAETRPRGGPAQPAASGDDLDEKLSQAIKGVEAKVEKSGKAGGIGGAEGPGSGQGGSAKTLEGPAGIGGEGPGGGGTVRGLEFVVYYNQMLNRIKDRWAWVGTRTDLRVTVQFSILPSGEITNIRLTERSGDQSFDASVERAVKGAGPLPPPPEAYRTDFADVELKFRPADLQQR